MGSRKNIRPFSIVLLLVAAVLAVLATPGFTYGETIEIKHEGKAIVDGKLGVGTDAVPKGDKGCGIVAIDGTQASTSGPHVQITTTQDQYPVLGFYSWEHGNIGIRFDCYWDGSQNRSSYTDATYGTNALISKYQDYLRIKRASRFSQGSVITWTDALTLNLNNGDVTLPGAVTMQNAVTLSGVTTGNGTAVVVDANGKLWKSGAVTMPGAVTMQNAVTLSAITAGSGTAVVADGNGKLWKSGAVTMPGAVTMQSSATIGGDVTLSLTVGSGTAVVVDTNGKLWKSSGSSIRYKENVRGTADADTSWIYGLRPVMFDYKDHSQGVNQCGLIAEEVERVYPGVVVYKEETTHSPEQKDANGNSEPNAERRVTLTRTKQPDSVRYDRLTVPMLAEMQKLRNRVQELEARLAQLESIEARVAQLESLEARIGALQAKN
jgi:hypothetical protein